MKQKITGVYGIGFFHILLTKYRFLTSYIYNTFLPYTHFNLSKESSSSTFLPLKKMNYTPLGNKYFFGIFLVLTYHFF